MDIQIIAHHLPDYAGSVDIFLPKSAVFLGLVFDPAPFPGGPQAVKALWSTMGSPVQPTTKRRLVLQEPQVPLHIRDDEWCACLGVWRAQWSVQIAWLVEDRPAHMLGPQPQA